MTITIDATFQEGTFKPAQRVELPEGAQVRLTITSADEHHDLLESADLQAAAQSSLDFWDHPWDDEDWNRA